jgi:hypothetical protein
MFLAVDPGVDTGWAYLDPRGKLNACGLGDPKPHPAYGSPIAVLIECPQIYPSRNSKGNPNDLIKVAVQVGMYKERFQSLGSVVNLALPHEWKGTIPKEKHHVRIFADLDPNEKEVLARAGQGIAPSKRHNIIDAVGLAKWGYDTALLFGVRK